MNATARARAALALLAAASAALWALAIWHRMSEQGDRLDLAAATCVTVSTVVAICSRRAVAQRENLREAMDKDRELFTYIFTRLSRRPGDGGPGETPAEQCRVLPLPGLQWPA